MSEKQCECKSCCGGGVCPTCPCCICVCTKALSKEAKDLLRKSLNE